MKKIFFITILFATSTAFAQGNKSSAPPINWQLMDWQKDGYPGISLEKAYGELLKNKKPLKKIIVAVIDDGVDDKHPDLAGMVWTNKKEIPGNGIDDDDNGYVDDIHGWNFIGNLQFETEELVREYVRLRKQFENNSDTTKLIKNPLYSYWLRIVAAKNGYLADMSSGANDGLLDTIQILQNYWSKFLDKKTIYIKDIRGKQPGPTADSSVFKSQLLFNQMESEEDHSKDDSSLNFILNVLSVSKSNCSTALTTANTIISNNNTEYFRFKAIGDNPNDNSKRNYGNAITSPDESHGTKCAGTIAALRKNNIGGNGISNSIEIMIVRIMPGHWFSTDERDKDVANAIRYAVENGAKVINLSIGKYLSPQKEWVDEAIKFAEQKGVLLIAAAGNDAINIDSLSFYPVAAYNDKIITTNFIKVGASTYDSSLLYLFSNYGIKTVNVFAPGVSIYTTSINNTYESVQGTSFAAPMVTGLAAFIWSYYPTLTYKQVKYCIEKSATPISILVTKPGTDEKVPFSSLSKSGGIVNAYKAIKLADEMMKK